jgi:hypothetical protein
MGNMFTPTVALSLEFPTRHYEACQKAAKCCADIRHAFSPQGHHPNPSDRLDMNNILYTNLESANEAVVASCKSMAKVIKTTGATKNYNTEYIMFLSTEYALSSRIAMRSLLIAPISDSGAQEAMRSFQYVTNYVRNPLNFSAFEPNLNLEF